MSDVTGMFRIIMEANGVYDFGSCPFELVKDKLLPCAAASRLPKEPKSVIAAVFPYRVEGAKGNLSMYASVPDYHPIVGRRLDGCVNALKKTFEGYDFVGFADNSPIPEVYTAAVCGLGKIGDNGLLINRIYGSWCFIGCIVTDLEIPYTVSEVEYCSHCGACAKACPGGALREEKFDKTKCLSFITQKKGELSEEERRLIKKSGCAWGCDVCQEVCPENKGCEPTRILSFVKNYKPYLDPDGEIDLEHRAYAWRGEAVIRRNLDILKKPQKKRNN